MKRVPFFVLLFLLTATVVSGGEPSIWSVNSLKDVAKGDARGVSIDDDGTIMLAPDLNESFHTEQSFVWSTVTDTAGNVYLGTGGEGKVFRVDAAGNGKLLFDSAEINVSALAIGNDGTLYAGTSPDGKVYRIGNDGKASVYFEPKEKYIWCLAVLSDGSLAVGTGENGKIYKVSSANAKPDASLFFDTSETHIISFATDSRGNLYAGTDSNGLVIRFSSDGKPFALLDSPLREIQELSVAKDGSVYVLALSESASTKTPKTPVDKKTEANTVSVGSGPKTGIPPVPTPVKSRYDLKSAKSVVYRILPGGGDDVLWNSDKIAAFSITADPNGNGVLIGTSEKGRIYSVSNDARETLFLQSDEEQISTLISRGGTVYATSSNQGKLFTFTNAPAREGTYESPVLDAKSVATWGRIWWRSRGDVVLQTRSGNTSEPDETWSSWSSPLSNQRGAQIASPKTKFLQWRATLKNGGGPASVSEVNVSFLARNIPPEVLSIEILPSNIGLAPTPRVPVDPNIKTLGLDPKTFGVVAPVAVPRKVFQSGAKSLQWKAEDRNGDRLEYSIYYRQVGESGFKLLRDGLTNRFFTIDGLTLADGRYVFKIIANDSPSNPPGMALTGERLSDPFDIDNTAPAVSAVGDPSVSGNNVRIAFEARESSSYIKRAEYSVDGRDWQTVYADDGISDGPRERYTVNLTLSKAGEYSVTLRVFDASGNSGSARVSFTK